MKLIVTCINNFMSSNMAIFTFVPLIIMTTPQATTQDKIKKSIRSPSIHLAKVGVTILFIVDHMGKERISSYALPNWWKWINYINPVHTSLLQQHQQIDRVIRPHLNTSAAIGWCAWRYGWSPRCHGFVNLDPSALEGEACILISADYLPTYTKFLSSTQNEPSLLKYGVGNIWLEYQTCLLRLNRGSLVMMLDNSVVSHLPEHNNSEKVFVTATATKTMKKIAESMMNGFLLSCQKSLWSIIVIVHTM